VRRSEFLAGVAASAFSPTAANEFSLLRLVAVPLGQGIDPYRDPEVGIDELAWLYADGLVGWERELVPLLAEVPRRADGGLRYHYRLRHAVWHDGRLLRAHDVAAAHAAVRATAFGTREPYRSVRDIVIHSDLDFDVVLDSARPELPRSFFGARGRPALPLLRQAGDGIPLGTGPFTIRVHPEPGRWRLERSTGSPRGVPALDAIELRLLTSDLTANVQLLSGEADLALPLPPAAIDSARFRHVERTTSTAVLLLNARGAFGEVTVRRAFARAIDVAALQRAYDRRRRALFASLLLVGGNDPAFERSLAFDPSAALILRAALRGRELAVAYVRESRAHERTATLLQQFLREAGVASALRPAPGSLYQGATGPLRTGRFDVAIAGFIYDDEPDLAADWSCSALPPAGGNFGRWCDAGFEAAAARQDVPGMLRRLYGEMACVPLSRAYEDIGVASRVRGFTAPEPLTPATYGCVGWSLAPGSSTSARNPSPGRPSISRRSTEA
jgi:ABC-type transport system substrate-binding protein